MPSGPSFSDFSYRHHFSTTDVRIWIQELLAGDWQSFEKKLKNFLRKVISAWDVGETQEELPRLAQEALAQLLTRDYHAEVENNFHVTDSLPLGLSFYGKDFCLEKKTWQRSHGSSRGPLK